MRRYTWSVLINGKAVSISAVDVSLKAARKKLAEAITADHGDEAAAILQQIEAHPPLHTLAKEATAPPIHAGKPKKVVGFGTAIAALAASIWAWRAFSAGLGIYPAGSIESRSIICVLAFAGVFAVFCILFGIHFLLTRDPLEAKLWKSDLQVWKVCLLAPWVILPPIWFSVEYYYLYPTTLPKEEKVATADAPAAAEVLKDSLERFKQGQEESSKVWLALVTLLTGIYFGKEFGGKAEE